MYNVYVNIFIGTLYMNDVINDFRNFESESESHVRSNCCLTLNNLLYQGTQLT